MLDQSLELNYLAVLLPIMFFSILPIIISTFKTRYFQHSDCLTIQRSRMVTQQLIRKGIVNKPLLSAMRKIPRHLFVTDDYQKDSYHDMPLPIACGQTMPQPYLIAYMIEKAKILPGDKVLEIGTGSGYTAAILSLLCKEVYTIEIQHKLAKQAEQLLHTLEYSNVFTKTGDGALGWTGKEPFDVIILTASAVQVPQALMNQLKVGGRIIAPISMPQQMLIRLTHTDTAWTQDTFFPVHFVPMQHDLNTE